MMKVSCEAQWHRPLWSPDAGALGCPPSGLHVPTCCNWAAIAVVTLVVGVDPQASCLTVAGMVV